MKDSLFSENSFIFDRNWQKINPKNQITVSLQQATQFITLLFQQHDKIASITQPIYPKPNMRQLQQKIHNFILKYIQQKQLGVQRKGELPFVKQQQYTFELKDCLQIWRWLSQDIASSNTPNQQNEQVFGSNEFQDGRAIQNVEIKKSKIPDAGQKKFNELPYQEQEQVMKKSLQMMLMYKHQLKIVFDHYCRFTIQNQHKRTNTFDDIVHSLEFLNINRFMLFCRQFDILKVVEFKRKTEHNNKISKQILTTIFKKTAHLQRSMNYDGFLLALINIAIKVHQNFDPRSFIHVELLLATLQVKYYQDFTKKLESLSIKYSPTQFYKCYKHIFKKALINRKNRQQATLFNNPYFSEVDGASSQFKESRDLLPESIKQSDELVFGGRNQSVPNLAKQQLREHEGQRRVLKNIQKRKKSLPLLPSIEDNRFFKPIEHNNHLNTYSKYLKSAEQSTSVFKNRITGYSNISTLKSKQMPFHMAPNPEYISKDSFHQFIADSKLKLKQSSPLQLDTNQSQTPSIQSSTLFHSNPSVIDQQPQPKQLYKNQSKQKSLQKQIQLKRQNEKNNVFQVNISKQPAPKTKNLNTNSKQKLQIIESLKTKIDLKDNDSLLIQHQQVQQSNKELTKPTLQLVSVSQNK